MRIRGWNVCLTIALVCGTTLGDTKPRAARSVHLWYQAEPGTLFYNEVSVDESTPDSYFCACGFSHGYFGIQELNEGKKIALFSVWDPGDGNDPKAVAADKRVETLEQGEGVQIGRFGGEGTGGQCKLPIEWKLKQTVKFCITANVSADKTKTAYTGWLFRPDQQRWQLMATFQTLSKGEALTGYYSFVEDFRRDGKSPDERRSARYCNGWVRTAGGEWISLTRAVFDADATPLDNVNAEPVENGFLLQTGGDIVQKNKLQTMLTRQPTGVNLPAKVYEETLRPQYHFTADRNWLNDPNGLVFFGGEYHLFFQRDPNTLGGEHKSWGHAVGADLVHWEQLADALSPDALGDVWSGSAVVDWNNTAGFQTGREPPLIAMFTAAGNPFSQCIAFSNDRGRTWTHYDKNPVIPHIIGGDRDPRLVWYAPLKQWIVALYLDKSTYAFFISPDLKAWTHLQDIDVPGCGECPDFFPMTVSGEKTEKWVFTAANGRYLVGTFDGKQFSPEQELRRVDFGANYYAVQSYCDIPPADGRRIQIAWMAGGHYPGMPFNQQMSFPAEMTLHRTPDGMRIHRVPVKEIETLHGKPLSFSNLTLAPGDDPLTAVKGDLFDIRAEIDLQQAREITLMVRGQKVTYSAKDQKLTCVGSAPLQLHDGRLSLQILVDRTSIETFANDGEVSITDCFLPAANAPALGVSATGGNAKIVSLEVYKLHSAWKTAGR